MTNLRGCLDFKMAELTVEQIIKLIIGVLVVVAMIYGAYYVFSNRIGAFFESIPTDLVRTILRW